MELVDTKGLSEQRTRILEGTADGQIMDGLDDCICFPVSQYGCGFFPLSCVLVHGVWGQTGRQVQQQACPSLLSSHFTDGKTAADPERTCLGLLLSIFGICPSAGPATWSVLWREGSSFCCCFLFETGVSYYIGGDDPKIPILLPLPPKY